MPQRRRFVASYAALATLRVLVAFTSQSTIHPDEHFQNPEVAAALWFSYSSDGDAPLRTWEWLGDSPCRSVVPVLGSTGRAFQLLRLVLGSCPGAAALFASQRAVMLLLSFCTEYALWRVSRRSKLSLLLFASSPVTFTLLLRPFSNSVETLLLAAAYLQMGKLGNRPSKVPLVGMGAVLAAGIFTRVTFAMFVLPLVLSVVIKLARQTSTRINDPSSLVRLALAGSPAVAGFLATSLLHAAIDTAYFHSGEVSLYTALRTLAAPRTLILTPLNLLRYNLSHDNLAEHGLHPRWLHAAVNAPMLFGAGLAVVGSGGADLLRGNKRTGHKRSDSEEMLLHLSCFVVPLGLLSLMPHQEPRFLLPLIVPLALLAHCTSLFRSGSRRAAKARKAVWALWLVHSLIFTTLFGYLHQGGLVPATLALNEQLRDTTSRLGAPRVVNVVFWRMFMPPRHLLLPLAPEGVPVPAVRITDLAGAPVSSLLSTLAILDHEVSPVVLAAPAYAVEAHGFACMSASPSATASTAVDSPAAPTPPSAVKRRCFEQLVPGRKSYGIHVDMDRLGDLAGARWDTAGVGLWMVE